MKPGCSLEKRDPQLLEELMPYLEWLYKYYFRVKTDGWHHIPKDKKVLLVSTHNGGLAFPDLWMMMYDWCRRFGCERPVYGLMHPSVWQIESEVTDLLSRIGAIKANPYMAKAAIDSDASVLVYPGGAEELFRPYTQRDRVYLAQRKGFIKLALREKMPIVPLISRGAHESLIVLGDCAEVIQQLPEWGMPKILNNPIGIIPIYLGLPWGLAVGALPNIPFPVPIYTRVCEPIVFERYGRDAAVDRNYVDACYQLVVTRMQHQLDLLFEKDLSFF